MSQSANQTSELNAQNKTRCSQCGTSAWVGQGEVWCINCAKRVNPHQHPTGKPPEDRLHIENRFWEKVVILERDQCWPWKRHCDKKGYGRFWVSEEYGKTGAHRMALALVRGLTDPDGLDGEVVRHMCDNESCCNPNHLLTGTYTENNYDAVIRGGIDHDFEPHQIRRIRQLNDRGTSCGEIASEYSTSAGHIRMICERKRYAWVD